MVEYIWVKPEMVVQVNFVNWTDANHLRRSSFLGIREDKGARDVVKSIHEKARPAGTDQAALCTSASRTAVFQIN